MRNLIGRRQGEITPRTRPRSGTLDNPIRNSAIADTNSFLRTVDTLLNDVETDLSSAQTSTETLQTELTRLAAQFKERAAELERARLELQNSKRQCELVKSLLADATAEKEIMYEVRAISPYPAVPEMLTLCQAFNEELDGMYNDANLPEDEAWQALSQDLRQTKETKNNLSRENS